MQQGYESICEEVNTEALRVYQEMDNVIKKIIRQVKNYNACCDEADYLQEAYLAILTAVTKYNEFRKFGAISINSAEDVEIFEYLKNDPGMKIQTFAYWFLQKNLYKSANMGEVGFIVTNEKGERVFISSEEYHKNKKNYKDAKSTKMKYNFSELGLDNGDGTEKELEPVSYETLVMIRNNNFKF